MRIFIFIVLIFISINCFPQSHYGSSKAVLKREADRQKRINDIQFKVKKVKGMGVLRGKITDEKNRNLSYVRIVISKNGTQVRTSINHNNKGKYYIANLKPGTYDVSFNLFIHKPIILNDVMITANHTTKLNIILKETPHTYPLIYPKQPKKYHLNANVTGSVRDVNVDDYAH